MFLDGLGSGLILYIVLYRGKLKANYMDHFCVACFKVIGTVLVILPVLCLVGLMYLVPTVWFVFNEYLRLLVNTFPGIWVWSIEEIPESFIENNRNFTIPKPLLDQVDQNKGLLEPVFVGYDFDKFSQKSDLAYLIIKYYLWAGSAVWGFFGLISGMYFLAKCWLYFRWGE